MTGSEEAERKSPADPNAQLMALLQSRILEWWAEHDDPEAARSALDQKIDALRRLDINLKIAGFTALTESVKALDADIVVAALRAADAGSGHPLIQEAIELTEAIGRGMDLATYLRHGIGRRLADTAWGGRQRPRRE